MCARTETAQQLQDASQLVTTAAAEGSNQGLQQRQAQLATEVAERLRRAASRPAPRWLEA